MVMENGNVYNEQNILCNKGYITRDKEGPSNSTSEYLSKEIPQNIKLKRHIHPYVH